MITKILIGLAGVIAIFLIVVALRPADFRVERSAALSAPPAALFENVTVKRFDVPEGSGREDDLHALAPGVWPTRLDPVHHLRRGNSLRRITQIFVVPLDDFLAQPAF